MRAPAAIGVVLVALAGCGGNGTSAARKPAGRAVDPKQAAKVIRAWADTLRKGDVAGAASFFALPSVVENGTPPIELRTRADARLFNRSLPCGARLLRTSSAGRFTTATFRLTERPGPGSCGQGSGQTAKTTFVIAGSKIREWRRVADNPAPSGPVI
jgi:hypothetical protein